MNTLITIFSAVTVLLSGCSRGLSNREKIISAAESISAGPNFPHHRGSAGSAKGNHFLYEGSFLVEFEEYAPVEGQNLDKSAFCWNVFQKYGDFIGGKIDLDSIPEMIAKGGSDQLDTNSTRYNFTFEAKDLGVIYEAEWFRGGPKEPHASNLEVQIRYRIRIN